MPSDSPTLRERFAADLRSGSFAVVATGVAFAMVVGLGVASYVDDYAVGVLLLILVGVMVPSAHERYWPQDRSRRRDVAWTLGASTVATGLYAGGYLLASRLVADATHAATLAFVGAILAGGVALRLLRPAG